MRRAEGLWRSGAGFRPEPEGRWARAPELIAQRILRFANAVGAENVIASGDCGFGTVAGLDLVGPKIAWAKLAAMCEGAAIATERLAK